MEHRGLPQLTGTQQLSFQDVSPKFIPLPQSPEDQVSTGDSEVVSTDPDIQARNTPPPLQTDQDQLPRGLAARWERSTGVFPQSQHQGPINPNSPQKELQCRNGNFSAGEGTCQGDSTRELCSALQLGHCLSFIGNKVLCALIWQMVEGPPCCLSLALLRPGYVCMGKKLSAGMLYSRGNRDHSL